VDVRFADLPQIQGASGRFLLQQMVAVAELEARMISTRTKAALAAAKARGRFLGGRRTRKSDGKPVTISLAARKTGAAANRKRAADRAADLAPTIAEIRKKGATTLQAVAEGLNAAGIQTPRGGGKWSPTQVQRTLIVLMDSAPHALIAVAQQAVLWNSTRIAVGPSGPFFIGGSMDQIETEAQIVREISATMFTDAVEIMAILHVLLIGNEKPRKEALNKAGAGRAAGHIERSLFTRLHFLVARGYADKTRPGDLHARRAFDMLKKPEVRKLVVERSTEETMKDAQDAWLKCIGDHRLQAFLHFRDKYLAHLGAPDVDIPIPTYKDVIGLSKLTAETFAKLALATAVVTLSLESQLPAHKKSAETFWQVWK
jgi:hypothetical protein